MKEFLEQIKQIIEGSKNLMISPQREIFKFISKDFSING